MGSSFERRGACVSRHGIQLLWVTVCNLLWRMETTSTRIALALGSLGWGVMLWWPGDTFARPAYSLMAQMLPELGWGSLFLLHGVYSLYSIITNQRGKLAFLTEGALGCALWTGSCAGIILSVYPPPAAIAGEISLAFFSWWHLVRFPLQSPEQKG